MAARRAEEQREDALWLSRIDPGRLPEHIAIIMDGNGRWATRRHLPRSIGHTKGAETAERIIRCCRHLPKRLAEVGVEMPAGSTPIRFVTLYTFSSENWTRPVDEVNGLMALIEQMLRDKLDQLRGEGVRIRQLGRAEGLPASLREELERDMAATADNQELTLFLALNYGGRTEIADAARAMAAAVGEGRMTLDEIDEHALARHLYAPDVPDPALVVRTGGDMRISNFLLWQIAYAELWVSATPWPAFRPAELYRAIAEYQGRDRRFGGLKSDADS